MLVHAAGWLFPEFAYVWLAEETKRNLPVELDFLNEGRNCEKIAKILSKFKFLKVSLTFLFVRLVNTPISLSHFFSFSFQLCLLWLCEPL